MWMASMAEHAGAARRQRERRLRPVLRHERMPVALFVAESTQHAASRGQKMARTREEVEAEQHEASRRQEPPPPRVPGRRGVTAPCGAPQGFACRSSPSRLSPLPSLISCSSRRAGGEKKEQQRKEVEQQAKKAGRRHVASLSVAGRCGFIGVRPCSGG